MTRISQHTFREKAIPYRCPIRLAMQELFSGRDLNPPAWGDGTIRIGARFTDGFDLMYARHSKEEKALAYECLVDIIKKVSNYAPQSRRSRARSEAAAEAAHKIYEAIEILRAEKGLAAWTKTLQSQAGMLEYWSFYFDPKSARHVDRAPQHLLAVHLMHAARQQKLGIKAAHSDRSKLGKILKFCCEALNLEMWGSPTYQLKKAKTLCDQADQNAAEYCGPYSEIDGVMEQFRTTRTFPDSIPIFLQALCFDGCSWLRDAATLHGELDETKLLEGQQEVVEYHLTYWMFNPEYQRLIAEKSRGLKT